MDCKGQTVVVIGGGSGIGRSAARLFLDAGAAAVAIADITGDAAQETADGLTSQGTVSAHTCDVTDLAQTQALMAAVQERHGRVDIVATTVGWSDTTFFATEEPEYWQRIIDINLMGAIHVARAAIDVMADGEGGSIVLTSSDAGKVGTMGETVYAAAKAGVIGFVKSLARESARDNVRVNAISPGPTDTPLLRAQSDQNVIDKMIRAVPLKRMATAREQAAAIVFLASRDAGYITGQTLSVSGGLTMTS